MKALVVLLIHRLWIWWRIRFWIWIRLPKVKISSLRQHWWDDRGDSGGSHPLIGASDSKFDWERSTFFFWLVAQICFSNMKKFVIRLHGEQDRRMSFDSESELDCLRFFFFIILNLILIRLLLLEAWYRKESSLLWASTWYLEEICIVYLSPLPRIPDEPHTFSPLFSFPYINLNETTMVPLCWLNRPLSSHTR